MTMIAQAYRVVAEHPLDIIALEECLVDSWTSEKMLLLFYVNPPSVIIGRNQNYWREVSPLCRVPVYRRSSGGGAVYHDAGNLNWALIVPRALHSQSEELSLMARAVSALGVYARPGDRGGIFVAMEDGETRGKISGTARRFGPRNVLHHGTLLVSTDLQALSASLGGIQTFEDVSIASVPATPVNLTRFVPSLSVEDAASRISVSLVGSEPRVIKLADLWNDHRRWPSQRLPFKNFEDLGGEDVDFCIDRRDFEASRDRFGSSEWLFAQSPPFSILVSQGKTRAIVRVARGRIAEILSLEADDRASLDYADMLQRFVGTLFSFEIKQLLEMNLMRCER